MEDEASVSGVSRRRLAFRPPIPPQKTNANVLTNEESQAAMVLATMDTTILENGGGPSTSGLTNNENDNELARKKGGKTWTHDDIMAYYEALKLYGKDFDSVARGLTKRKVMKDKDQIKNYFYNSLKIIKQLLSIEEEDLGGEAVPKDAKELFLALNACEWKKRTNNGKFVSERLKELLFEGSTTVRMNKKSVQIKTPPCPSLIKWFTKNRRVEKFPSDVIFCLKPMSNSVSSFIRSSFQNPLLKVRMSTNERLAKLIELLKKKWANGDSCKNIRIWPSFKTEVGRLQVVETDISPFVALSLNKLRKETEEVQVDTKDAQPNSNNIGGISKDGMQIQPKYNVLYPKPFTLTDEIMKEGISEKNVGNIIVAELYCTCGMTDIIELQYEMDIEPRLEPWEAMIDMLSRDYGDSICAPLPVSTSSAPAPIIHTNSKSSEEPPVQKKIIEEEPIAKKPKINNHQNTAPDIVQAENDAFKNQLLGLRKSKVNGKKSIRSSPAIINSSLSINNRNPQVMLCSTPIPHPIVEQQQQNPIVCQLIPKSTRESPKKSMINSPKTDFSDFNPSPIKCDSRQRKLNEQFLDSLKTPTKTPKKPAASIIDSLFGDISMSPSTTRKSLNPQLDDDLSRCELTDILFGEISSTPTKYLSQNVASTNPQPTTSLGFSDSEVQQSFHDMITSSQDSRDFVLQQFIGQKNDNKNCKKRL